ncbi:MAG: ParB/RepB/Spo0J family partition protein [Amphiplicatus sp.]
MAALKRPSGLGRGLDALLGDAPKARPAPADEAPAKAAAPTPRARLPIEFLAPNPDQPRRYFAEDALDELAASIRAKGLLQPILVRPAGDDRYEIVAGERRWRAAQKAKLHEVPVIIRTLTDEETAEIALIENVQRVDLNAIEEAGAYHRLAETHRRSHDEIAKAVGKSRSHVTNTLRLLTLPKKAVDALILGDITAGHARALLASNAPDYVLELVLEQNLTVRQTERLVYDKKAGDEARRTGKREDGSPIMMAPKQEHRRKDADTRALEADLAAALGLEVDIRHTPKGAGAITISYLTLDQLDDVIRRLTGSGA